MQKSLLIAAIVLIVIMVVPIETMGQCPMCRMAAESNLKSGGAAGKGLNNGILYLLATPYLLVLLLALLWRRQHSKLNKAQ